MCLWWKWAVHRWSCIGNGHLVGTHPPFSASSPQPQCGPESLNEPPLHPPTPMIKNPPKSPTREDIPWKRHSEHEQFIQSVKMTCKIKHSICIVHVKPEKGTGAPVLMWSSRTLVCLQQPSFFYTVVVRLQESCLLSNSEVLSCAQ